LRTAASIDAAGCLNPPADRLGAINAVMGSAGRGPHHVRSFAGPLSVKFMLRGSGVWRSESGVHVVDEGYFLVLNDGQTYSLDIDGGAPRESFCPCFRRGLVEDIQRTLTVRQDRLLEEASGTLSPVRFHPHLHRADRRVIPALLRLRRLVYTRTPDPAELEERFIDLGEMLLAHATRDLAERIARVPAARSSTRRECYRRLATARDFLHANAHRRIGLGELGASACLSPYHFHRLFRAVYGVTPLAYLTRLRVDRARRLLRDSEEPVTSIGMAVGFESPAAFSRRFSREVGTSPRQYRASQFRKNGKAPRADAKQNESFGQEE